MKKGKRLLTVLLSVVIGLVSLLGVMELTAIYAWESWEFWYAYDRYEKKDLTETLNSTSELTADDYALLFEQTGLTKLGVDGLLSRGEEGKKELLKIQNFYMKKHEVARNNFAPYSYIDELKEMEFGAMGALENGDIIVSATTSISFFRFGHAVIVVDGEAEDVCESYTPGTVSEISDASTAMGYLACYMVLRPTKIPKEIRDQVADYAKQSLLGIPYDFTVGVLSKKYPEKIEKTQCSHLCWYAYKRYGYDIDCNGGLVVKPQDLANSPYMEVVQIFGFNPQKLWK